MLRSTQFVVTRPTSIGRRPPSSDVQTSDVIFHPSTCSQSAGDGSSTSSTRATYDFHSPHFSGLKYSYAGIEP